MNMNENFAVFTIDRRFVFRYKKNRLFKKLRSISNNTDQPEWQLLIKNDNHIEITKGFVAVLGESGAGKSTLVSILSGFEKLSRKSAENITYLHRKKGINYDSSQIKKIQKEDFGFIFQRCYESKSLNAADNISMPLFNKFYSAQSIRQYCRRLLESLHLSHVSHSPANELSGGQLTRIGILRGIAQTPQVIFADEPANNLDEQNAGLILKILQNWMEQTDGTVIMVTHHLEHAFKFADQIIVLQSTSENSGEIVYQKVKSGQEWSATEKQEIRDLLDIKENRKKTQFPKPPTSTQKSFLGYLLFLLKVSWANISSKADGSRTISSITLCSFFLLFFIAFSGNLILQWFTQMDNKKNNAAYLRQFEISVAHPPGLSNHIQDKISQTKVKDVRLWLANKINKTYRQLDRLSSELDLKQPHYFLNNTRSEFNFAQFVSEKPLNQLIDRFKEYGYYLSAFIKNNPLSTVHMKKVKSTEKISHKLIRYAEFYLDLSPLEATSKICEVYPRWESGPEFVKKNGERRNLTTTMRWLDYQDPFFDDPRLTYLKHKNFRFQSNKDEGIIIDIETLVHDLGYDINDDEIKVLYGNKEKACVPVKAVVERM